MAQLRTPYFLMDEGLLKKNLELLCQVQDEAGCKILLAQKAFSMFACYPLISQYLAGTTASGLYEARLGREEFPGEVHVFSPAYREEEFQALLGLADHFVFNSPSQLRKYARRAREAGKQVGLRVNPECSTQEGHAIYDPCAPGSRLGTTLANFDESLLPLLDGLHFHTLCEQNSDDLETTAILMIPTLPSAENFAEGLSITSMRSMLSAGNCSNICALLSLVSPLDLPLIHTSTLVSPRRDTFPSLSTSTEGIFSKASEADSPTLDIMELTSNDLRSTSSFMLER